MVIQNWLMCLTFRLKRLLYLFVLVSGVLFGLMVILSFTESPFWAYFWLGTYHAQLDADPELIVLLGGSGMPGPDGLMRCYRAAEAAREFPLAKIIIAVPQDTARKEKSPELLMCHELMIRQVDTSRVLFECLGMNTRTQALNIRDMLVDSLPMDIPIRIVTSPEHMFRSLCVFRKLGFNQVGGMSAFGDDLNEGMLKKNGKQLARSYNFV